MGRICSRHGRRGMHIGIWWKSQKKRGHQARRRWEDNIGMYLEEMTSTDWRDLAQDRDQWRALVNTVMKLRVP
jgi:hypothetical protein